MARRRGKKLNIPLIKGAFMFVMGAVIAAGSALTGIGAQVAAEPTIDFLLGFAPERTAGTSMVFTLVAAACGAITAGMGKIHVDNGQALAIAFGGLLGALVATSIVAPTEGEGGFSPKWKVGRRV